MPTIQNQINLYVNANGQLVSGSEPTNVLYRNTLNKNIFFIITPLSQAAVVKLFFQNTSLSKQGYTGVALATPNKGADITAKEASYYELVKDWAVFKYIPNSTILTKFPSTVTGSISLSVSIKEPDLSGDTKYTLKSNLYDDVVLVNLGNNILTQVNDFAQCSSGVVKITNSSGIILATLFTGDKIVRVSMTSNFDTGFIIIRALWTQSITEPLQFVGNPSLEDTDFEDAEIGDTLLLDSIISKQNEQSLAIAELNTAIIEDTTQKIDDSIAVHNVSPSAHEALFNKKLEKVSDVAIPLAAIAFGTGDNQKVTKLTPNGVFLSSELDNTANKVPTNKAVKDYVDSNITTLQNNLTAYINTEVSNLDDELSQSITTGNSDTRSYAVEQDNLVKAFIENTYAKKSDLANVYKYQGTFQTYADLVLLGEKTLGFVYNVVQANGNIPAGTNYAWNGTAWDALGGSVDLSNYYNKAEVDSKDTGTLTSANNYTDLAVADKLNKISDVVLPSNYLVVGNGDNKKLRPATVYVTATMTNSNGQITTSKGVKDYVDNKVVPLLTPITWQDLKALRDNNELVTGMKYRITDYTTTTTQAESRSAGNDFDIIVTALDSHTLSENASACKREGDTYFSGVRTIPAEVSEVTILSGSGTNADPYTVDSEFWLTDIVYRFKLAGGVVANANSQNYFRLSGGSVSMPFSVNKTFSSAFTNGVSEPFKSSGATSFAFDTSLAFTTTTGAAAKLESWKLKYSLDNDTERFAWADSVNGKGVIYRMIDEFNNDCPYDFKNIQFLRDGVYYFTFTWITEEDTVWDASIHPELTTDEGQGSRVFNNVIPLAESGYGYILNDNVFIADYDTDSGFFYGWYWNIAKGYFVSNTFNDFCYSNTFGDNCHNNTFGEGCQDNTFGNDYYNNTIGAYCQDNTFDNNCSGNIFDNNCSGNIFGNSFSHNTFGDYCSYNTFGNSCYGNTFGNALRYNIFENNILFVRLEPPSNIRIENSTFKSGLIGTSSSNKLDLYSADFNDKQMTFELVNNTNPMATYTLDTSGEKKVFYKSSKTASTWTQV